MKTLDGVLIIIVLFTLNLFISCKTSENASGTDTGPTTVVDSNECKEPSINNLAWIDSKHPERIGWGEFLISDIKLKLNLFELAQDAERVYPGYSKLKDDQKVLVWAQFIVMITKFESSFNPTSRYQEKTMKDLDPVTKDKIWSEGLMQMSYQDTVNYAGSPFNLGKNWCGFDWSKDKLLSPTDPKKTILDPKINLDCGVKVLANQISYYGKAIVSKGVYWAVINDGGKYQNIDAILKGTQQLKFCGVK